MNTTKLRGQFSLKVVNAETGATRIERDFDNLIVDNGLERWARGWPDSQHKQCAVGTGNRAPAVTDTTLQQQIASVGLNLVGGGVNGEPYYERYQRLSGRFAAGAIANTISEIGIFGNGQMWCRQLILDDQGQPSAITVLQNEYLDVVYTLYSYPNLDDIQFEFTMNGVTYTCVSRMALASRLGVSATYSYFLFVTQAPQIDAVYSTQTLGTILTQPGGTSVKVGGGSGSYNAWDANDPYSREFTLVLPQGAGNVAGGIGSMLLRDFYGPDYRQISFDPVLPKYADTEITLVFKDSVSRWAP